MTAPPAKYINRELSWLEFNQRVLDEACHPDTPLLERLKFLAITSSNLDEFFMVRVGGLTRLAAQQHTRTDPAGLTPEEQLEAITRRVRKMTKAQYKCYLQEIEPALAEHGIRRIAPEELTENQNRIVEQMFEGEVYAVLSPLAVTSADDFPLLINHSLNICVQLKPAAETPKQPRFAVIPFGRNPARFVTLPSDGGYAYMLLEDVVTRHVDRFFPGEEVIECVPFRLTRNADMAVREDQAPDLMAQIEQVLDERKESDCVRLEIADSASQTTRTFLTQTLEISPATVHDIPGPLDLASFMKFGDLHGFDELKFEPWHAQPSPDIDPAANMFEILSRRDVLLYHPYESFEPVVRLIEQAADDPEVLAIKQTLYRTSRDSPIVAALARAAENGKYVTAIVELKARFDEARNIEWAGSLERAGVQVMYGVKGLKTHAKICVIVRREPHGIQRYVHFGTGNYNESTARLYSDVSYLTTNEDLAADATSFFNAVTGYSQPQNFRRLEMAPIGLRDSLLEMIENEIQRKQQGQRARILAKINSLVDPQLIDALYAASQAGVEIKLNIRGICCLRPGVEGLSENITVVSIVDRFLEHARIVSFYHGGNERLYISSADWMPRNLDRRVELLVPVDDPRCRERLSAILKLYFKDNVKARRLRRDGGYRAVAARKDRPQVRSQYELYQHAVEEIRRAEMSPRTMFEPHRAPESSG